jgi:hypothetical protein
MKGKMMTVSETSRHTSIETLAGHRAAVHWYPALLDAFPAPEEQRKIVGLIDAEMRAYDGLTFYVCYTDVGIKEIVWSSEHDETTDNITVEVDLSERFTRDEEGKIVFSKKEVACVMWLKETYPDGTPTPDTRTLNREFIEWYAAQEQNPDAIA